MENLIGKKVKGFKYEARIPVYTKAMDKHIGEIGEIVEINFNSFKIKFKNTWWHYPLSEIHKHLVEDEIQPFEKVWAWYDKYKEEAFETYFIKKAVEGYWVICEDDVVEYEVECDFTVSTYENISRTNPNPTPNDVIKIIEKYGEDKLITLIESYKN